MKHGELRNYNFECGFRPGVVIKKDEELFIVPVRCIKSRNSLIHIPLTINDGLIRNNEGYALCEDIEKFDKSKDDNIFFNNVTNETLEKIMQVIN